ncbi:hypothetical protein ACTFR8_22390 [Bacillus cereus group sp. MYBK15-3]|uniref:hypothetical protein n=1 Tax=Bacillus cereus group TaxID=86661 RepID=UPI001C8B2622|nr:hypothetical protein [Bacillus cereus]MBX9158351.1 hypothetical protein [Bacillus cereus]
MATRLELAKQKLERLRNELNSAIESDRTHYAQTNGQPMNDKRNAGSFFKRAKQIENKIFRLLGEVKAQEERVEALEWKEENRLSNASKGLNKYGGLDMSVENIPLIKEMIRKSDNGEKVPVTRATILKYKKQLVVLEKMAEKSEENTSKMDSRTEELIESGKVIQWKKKPIYYFVKGLRKVALVIDENGLFKVSAKYPVKTEEEQQIIDGLLA